MHRPTASAPSRRPVVCVLGALALACAWPIPVPAQEPAESSPGTDYLKAQESADCVALALRAPEDALGSAETWEQQGGGDAARHCRAVALFGLGEYPESAELFETIGESVARDSETLAAEAFAQAGMAWQAADMYERALAAQTAAIELAPDDVGMLVDRSTTQFFLGKCWEAIDDLNEAHERAPERAGILVLRASAYRCVESPELARADVDRALELEPGNPEALLERGTLRHQAGDEDGARADWLQVARDAAGTPTADAAQRNLERLDVQAQ